MRLTKVLIDGGSELNVLYSWTYDAMGLSIATIRPTNAPIFGVVPEVRVSPHGQITLPVTFGGQVNFRTKMLNFEIIDLPSAYQAILGRPCHMKFMVVPNYAYLKLKLSGPRGIIIVSGDLHQAHSWEEENLNITAATSLALELRTI